MRSPKAPDIFGYTDYRKFLKDCFVFKKKQNRNFSFRGFSQSAGLASPSALKEVMSGKKGIAPGTIHKYIRPFRLSRTQELFFEKLVLFNQARDEEEKSRYFRELVKLQRSPKSKKITPRQYTFYGNWYNAAIRELVTIKDFKNDPEWIAGKIKPSLTPRQVKEALLLLEKLGFIKKDGNGKFVQSAPKLEPDPDASAQAIRDFNRNMIELGWEAIGRFDPKDREVSGLTLGMSRSCYKDVREMIRQFKADLLNYVCRHPENVEMVGQVNFQLFPLIGEDGANIQKKRKGK